MLTYYQGMIQDDIDSLLEIFEYGRQIDELARDDISVKISEILYIRFKEMENYANCFNCNCIFNFRLDDWKNNLPYYKIVYTINRGHGQRPLNL